MLYLSPPLTVCLLFFALTLGAVMGSFLNCAAWRLVHKESLIRGRSHCALCGHTLGAADLIPVFSFLALKGRCRYCGKPISWRYPAVEAVCALTYCTLLLRFDVSLPCLRFLILLSLLLFGALVDYEDGWIPDRRALPPRFAIFPFRLPRGAGGCAVRRDQRGGCVSFSAGSGLRI